MDDVEGLPRTSMGLGMVDVVVRVWDLGHHLLDAIVLWKNTSKFCHLFSNPKWYLTRQLKKNT